MARFEELRSRLRSVGQSHLLTFADELNDSQQCDLFAQIDQIDLEVLDELIERFVRNPVPDAAPRQLEPVPYYGRHAADSPIAYDADYYRQVGEDLIRDGKVAAFTVAGGQGTRLGWNGPKGTFPATVVTGKPLFRCFAEQIVATERKYGITVPWYIMTSPMNDDATRSFFVDNNCFGLARNNIFMFPQGVMPSLDKDSGLILMESRHQLALNPDGHGGSLKALSDSGAIEDLGARGIEHISYFQIDNPMVRVIDPLFVGLHAAAPDSSAEMSSKMVAKAEPDEKVGVFCRDADDTVVVEYSNMPKGMAGDRDDNGQLRYNAGSTAIHMIAVAFVERLTADRRHFGLPLHRAVKKVEHIDMQTGELVKPDTENAVKLETFVFDALRLARSSIILETDRAEEFAPIKNGDGTDSPATSNQLQSNRAGNWLEARGVTIPRSDNGDVNARIEISPLTALEQGDLADTELPSEIAPGDEVVL